MYVNPNYSTKKALKDAVKAGKTVEVFQPGVGIVPANGEVTIEGPHYPQPHRWYARGTIVNGKLTKVK